MKIASWNVNSLRVRLEHVLDWLAANPVDVLVLQETKLIDENFFKRNAGVRIDLILASELLNARCVSSAVDPTPRGLERPSDHAPVVADFD